MVLYLLRNGGFIAWKVPSGAMGKREAAMEVGEMLGVTIRPSEIGGGIDRDSWVNVLQELIDNGSRKPSRRKQITKTEAARAVGAILLVDIWESDGKSGSTVIGESWENVRDELKMRISDPERWKRINR
jgi:hypothetical protein